MQKINFIQPRVIRLKNAPHYLDMDKNLFNKNIHSALKQTYIRIQGMTFDRLNLDARFKHFKEISNST